MAKTREVTYTVKGRGAFPKDMLRYDECRAATSEDQAKIDYVGRDRREVTLIGRYPTEGRWESFLWIITEIKR